MKVTIGLQKFAHPYYVEAARIAVRAWTGSNQWKPAFSSMAGGAWLLLNERHPDLFILPLGEVRPATLEAAPLFVVSVEETVGGRFIVEDRLQYRGDWLSPGTFDLLLSRRANVDEAAGLREEVARWAHRLAEEQEDRAKCAALVAKVHVSMLEDKQAELTAANAKIAALRERPQVSEGEAAAHARVRDLEDALNQERARHEDTRFRMSVNETIGVMFEASNKLLREIRDGAIEQRDQALQEGAALREQVKELSERLAKATDEIRSFRHDQRKPGTVIR